MVNRLLVALVFLFFPFDVIAQAKAIKPIITIEGINKKPVDSLYIVIPNSPCDTLQLRLNGKLFSVHNNYDSDSNARLFKVVGYNTLQIVCGSIRTTTVKISNKSRYVYVNMDERSCDLYFSDERMVWEGWKQ